MFVRRHFTINMVLFFLLASAQTAHAEMSFPTTTPLMDKYERISEPRKLRPADERDNNEDDERYSHVPVQHEENIKTLPPGKSIEKSAQKTIKSSDLEKMYSDRSENNLQQFGYDLFGVPAPDTRMRMDSAARNEPEMPMGAVQDDFILNAGDELEIIFTGQRTDRGLYKVDSKGLIIIEDLPPIPAAGRSIGQVRVSIEMAARQLHNTEAYVSLSSVRQIGVLVVGHVKMPGRQTLTVFHTVVDALMEAGGIDKTGSLRRIKLVREGRTARIDLYELLMNGSADMDLKLHDGDRIIVPSIGPTVAVAGEVKRPGVFEILPDEKLSLDRMLDFGGGVLAPGKNRYLNLEVTPSGQEKVSEIHKSGARTFGDGSILMVSKGQEKRADTIELKGHTLRPGLHALAETPTLGKLLSSPDFLKEDAYPLLGLIERRDPETLARTLIGFPLRETLKGSYDSDFKDGDIVHIFSSDEIKYLNDPIEAEKHDAKIEDETIAAFLMERAAFVRGAVRSPGPYPVAEGGNLEGLLAVAGGPTLEADTGNVEITVAPQEPGEKTMQRININLQSTNPSTVRINAGDAVRLNQKFQRVEDKSVLVIGEIRNPGRYDLLPGDKVSDLLKRAGGLTDQAYPDGAIFSRENERKAEQARFRAQARDMQRSIAAAIESDEDKVSAGQIAEARALAIELETAEGVGRITAEADPAVLGAQPELDMLLEPGDRLYIPARSLTVRVSGEILSPANLQFRENKKPLDYIREAGDFTYNADKDRTFVLYPDGSAQPLQVSAWNYKPVMIPPGSTIVVPRDPKPFDFIESARDVSQILSNLAITTLFISDVRDDD